MMNERISHFSPCRCYRYTLWREWDMYNTSFLMVIGLNPSTANEIEDDPTIRRCVAFAKRWGFGALCMANLFAFRATDPDEMKAHPEPIGPETDAWLRTYAPFAGIVLAGWGRHGKHMGRDAEVRKIIRAGLKCLRKNADGSPVHPLYVPAITQPIPL